MLVGGSRYLIFLFFSFPLLVLNIPFLDNPLFFDDQYFFLRDPPSQLLDAEFVLYPRSWVYRYFAIDLAVFDGDVRWLRLGNLVAHVGVSIVLFFFVKRLLSDLDLRLRPGLNPDIAAMFVAVLFAFHPLATLTHGYLVQRTILLSTLFSMLSLYTFWLGLKGERWGILLSCLSYFLSVFAKEHSILTPACACLLWVLHWRSGFRLGAQFKWVVMGLLCQAVVAVFVVLQMRWLVGSPYEPMTEELMDGGAYIHAIDLFPFSFLNQCYLFFKYIFLWVLPVPSWLSVDIREPFPLTYNSWGLWVGFVCFMGYAALGGVLLWRGRALGVLGFSMLVPLVLFLTELSVVRFQEPFVLYRSYLWAVGGFVALAFLLRRISSFVGVSVVIGFLLFFMAMSFDRLTTFSHSFFIWDEAAALFEKTAGGEGVFGGYRIYFNRGNSLLREGMLTEAMNSYNRALVLNPDFYQAVHQRGLISLQLKDWGSAQADFQSVIAQKPSYISSYIGLAEALKAQGHSVEASNSLRVACLLGEKSVCE